MQYIIKSSIMQAGLSMILIAGDIRTRYYNIALPAWIPYGH